MEIHVNDTEPYGPSVTITGATTDGVHSLGIDASTLHGGRGYPIGGTYRLSFRHAASAPIPHDAGQADVNGAMTEMTELDERITAEHQANPDAHRDCRVCFPVPYQPSHVPQRRIIERTWDVIRWTPAHVRRVIAWILEPE